jgi:hypothetical protein
MRLPRVRFTVRRMMVAVAITAGILWAAVEVRSLPGRAESYRIRAALDLHMSRAADQEAACGAGPCASRVADYYRATAAKYRRASRFPRLPLPPDPPYPE